MGLRGHETRLPPGLEKSGRGLTRPQIDRILTIVRDMTPIRDQHFVLSPSLLSSFNLFHAFRRRHPGDAALTSKLKVRFPGGKEARAWYGLLLDGTARPRRGDPSTFGHTARIPIPHGSRHRTGSPWANDLAMLGVKLPSLPGRNTGLGRRRVRVGCVPRPAQGMTRSL
jgi:hypothetical protein